GEDLGHGRLVGACRISLDIPGSAQILELARVPWEGDLADGAEVVAEGVFRPVGMPITLTDEGALCWQLEAKTFDIGLDRLFGRERQRAGGFLPGVGAVAPDIAPTGVALDG